MSHVSFHFEDHRLVVVCEGHYSSSELRDAWVAAVASAQWPEVRGVVIDVRRSASLRRRSVEELRATTGHFAMELAEHDLPCALLVEGAVRYGLMRMASAWIPKGVRVRVFRDQGEAQAWLAATGSVVG